MIYIRTHAYNAEKTLRRTIESVLKQTYSNFEYHILDNGSRDKTGDIIREYAGRDKRIVPYFNKVNHAYQENPDFWNLSRHIPEGDYFCILDADDAYAPAFFQEMLDFMEENHLEIAACGTVFLDAGTGQALGTTVLEDNVIVNTPRLMNAWFSTIHWNLRQVWGKLYSSRAAAARYETEVPDWFPKAYGGDTVNVMQCVRTVKQFGVYAKALHYYTVSVKSVSHQWIPGREEADLILYQKAVEFLEECCGIVTEQNRAFLYVVYFNALADTLRVLTQSVLTLKDKLAHLNKILSYPVTREMFSADLSSMGLMRQDQKKLLYDIPRWLLSQAEVCREEHTALLIEIFNRLNPDFASLVPADTLLWYLQKTPRTVQALVEQDYGKAAVYLQEQLKNKLPEIFSVILAQTLAALLQDDEAYIRYSKLLLEMQIRNGLQEQAKVQLEEWEQLLPGDPDLAGLRRLLTK